MSGASLVDEVPPGSVIRTGGGSSPARGGSANSARQQSMAGPNFGFFPLTTLPVSASMSAYARSPTTPPSITSAVSSSSPGMDFTGNLQSAAMAPTDSLIA